MQACAMEFLRYAKANVREGDAFQRSGRHGEVYVVFMYHQVGQAAFPEDEFQSDARIAAGAYPQTVVGMERPGRSLKCVMLIAKDLTE